jgi:hypothetical protein
MAVWKDRLVVGAAGDEVKSKQIVMGLLNDTGFDAVDAGSLDESWRQQPSTPAYCCDYGMEMMRKGLAAQHRSRLRAPNPFYGAKEYVHLTAKRVSRICGGFAGAMLANCVPTL